MEMNEKQKHELLHSKIELRAGYDTDGTFKVNGVEMGHVVGHQMTVDTSAGDANVTVKIFAEDILVEGGFDLKVDLPYEVVVALKAAGWTPPGQGLSVKSVADVVREALDGWNPVVRVDGREFYGEMKRINAIHGGS